jgi:hypothetical protein
MGHKVGEVGKAFGMFCCRMCSEIFLDRGQNGWAEFQEVVGSDILWNEF